MSDWDGKAAAGGVGGGDIGAGMGGPRRVVRELLMFAAFRRADVGRPILAAAAFLGGSGRLKAAPRGDPGAKLPAPQGAKLLSLYYGDAIGRVRGGRRRCCVQNREPIVPAPASH
jgi:hypothetical protein